MRTSKAQAYQFKQHPNWLEHVWFCSNCTKSYIVDENHELSIVLPWFICVSAFTTQCRKKLYIFLSHFFHRNPFCSSLRFAAPVPFNKILSRTTTRRIYKINKNKEKTVMFGHNTVNRCAKINSSSTMRNKNRNSHKWKQKNICITRLTTLHTHTPHRGDGVTWSCMKCTANGKKKS